MERVSKRRRLGIVDLWQREVGGLSPRIFAHRAGASEDLVLRLGILRKLNKHRSCVNALSFNGDGDILASGSDDRTVILWDWETGLAKLSFHSGHRNNVFQARFMPCSEDRILVTCAADGQVRHARILEGGQVETKSLAQHEGRAHSLAIEPGNPHVFYSCGEDGLVQHIDMRTMSATGLFTCKSFHDKSTYMPNVQLNAIAIDPRNPNLFAVAGSDEFARVYDIRKHKWDGFAYCSPPTDCFCPPHLIGDQDVGITGLAFSDQSELVASYSDEKIYLFSKDQGLGPDPVIIVSSDSDADDVDTSDGSVRPMPQVYKGHRNKNTVKGVSFVGPSCEYVVSGSDCGRVFIWRKKGGELLRVMEGDTHIVNFIEPHPYDTMFASSGIDSDVKIWTSNALEPAAPVKIEEVYYAGDELDSVYYLDSDDDDYFLF